MRHRGPGHRRNPIDPSVNWQRIPNAASPSSPPYSTCRKPGIRLGGRVKPGIRGREKEPRGARTPGGALGMSHANILMRHSHRAHQRVDVVLLHPPSLREAGTKAWPESKVCVASNLSLGMPEGGVLSPSSPRATPAGPAVRMGGALSSRENHRTTKGLSCPPIRCHPAPPSLRPCPGPAEAFAWKSCRLQLFPLDHWTEMRHLLSPRMAVTRSAKSPLPPPSGPHWHPKIALMYVRHLLEQDGPDHLSIPGV